MGFFVLQHSTGVVGLFDALGFRNIITDMRETLVHARGILYLQSSV